MTPKISVTLLVLICLLVMVQPASAQTAATKNRGNAVPREALPQELQDLEINDGYIAIAAAPAAYIRTIIGHVVVLHADRGQAFFAAVGDAIFEHDVIFTLADSRCRLKFTTKDVVTMGDNARLGLEEYIDNRKLKKKTSIFSMLRGKAMFYALRLFKYRVSVNTVKTPTAIVGVRGTKFGVEVKKENGSRSASAPVYLAAATDKGLKYLGAQVPPAGTVTIAHCFTGAIDVTALADNTTQTLYENESRLASSERGEDVLPTPPDVAQQFEAATEAPDPAATPQEGQPTATTTGGDDAAFDVVGTDEGAATGSEVEVADEVADITSTQTGVIIETAASGQKGYFSGMLTQDSGGTKTFAYLYLSQALQYAESQPAKAHDPLIGKDVVVEDIDDGDTPQMTALDIPAPYTISGFPYTVQSTDLGFNAYMEWGNWTQTQPMPGSDGNYYYFDNHGYWIDGDVTSEGTMDLLKANNIFGTYSGSAYGTYWTNTGGADMSGTFSAEINFGAAVPITNFEIHVSGNGHSVDISGAQGQFTDPYNPSHFVVPSGGASGSWQIDGVAADVGTYTKNAYGSVYGPNGEAMGGVWKIDASVKHATGIFQGVK